MVKTVHFPSVLLLILMANQVTADSKSGADKFAQLTPLLPTANSYRTASGAPGADYWQQKVDYSINVTLSETARSIQGQATINYENNSPDTLPYLWLQLDQNRFTMDSADNLTKTVTEDKLTFNHLRWAQALEDNTPGYQITKVIDSQGRPLGYQIVGTMLRIDLNQPLVPNKSLAVTIAWQFNIVNEVAIGSRGGYEMFTKTDTYIYFLAQWFRV